MSEDKIYVVYRIYNKAEKFEHGHDSHLYGWSASKHVIDAFLSQRDKNKYLVEKSYANISEIISGYYNDLDSDNMIDYIILKSSKTHEEVHFFMTSNEMREAEIKVQRYFRDLCCISDLRGDADYMKMFMNIKDRYREALEYIGYRPPEISAMFPSADFRDDPGEIIGITELIDQAYSGYTMSPSESDIKTYNPLGLSMFSDIAIQILYSIESFIKVLREDL